MTPKRAACNTGLAKVAVQCSADQPRLLDLYNKIISDNFRFKRSSELLPPSTKPLIPRNPSNTLKYPVLSNFELLEPLNPLNVLNPLNYWTHWTSWTFERIEPLNPLNFLNPPPLWTSWTSSVFLRHETHWFDVRHTRVYWSENLCAF